MSVEADNRGRMSEQERLGEPDFTGKWVEGNIPEWRNHGEESIFRMYILNRKPIMVEADASKVLTTGVFNEKAEIIEGIIFDVCGLAVFTGLLKGDSIAFTKIYSESAIAKGGSSDKIFYKGIRGEISGEYLGYYGFKNGLMAGSFILTVNSTPSNKKM